MLDIKITGGRIIDGTGCPGFRADIGIQGDKIVCIADLTDQPAVKHIRADGKVVAPGFIDMHTHSDLSLLENPDAEVRLYDGVTTDVIGNCGIGPAPLSKKNRDLLLSYLDTRLIGSVKMNVPFEWESFGEYLACLESNPASINIAPLVAQGSIRIAEMGFEIGQANETQLKNMQRMAAQSLEAGALGMTTGLAYLPGAYTSTEELAQLAKALQPYGGLYISHIRDQAAGVFQSIEEAAYIGKTAGVPVHISHIKLAGPSVRGKTEALFHTLDRLQKDGLSISFDLYPYDAGNTALTTVLPPWVFEGGIDALVQRIHDPHHQMRIIEDCAAGIPGWQNYSKDLGWHNIRISNVTREENRQYEGSTIQQIADDTHSDPWTVVFDLLYSEHGRVQTIVSHLDRRDVDAIVTHPDAIYGSDSMSLSLTGPLSSGKPHPRAFGTHGKILGEYVRERKLMTLEQAIHKMTLKPARRLNLLQRGALLPGYYADIVILDPDTVCSKATYAQPKLCTEGISSVLVNGIPVLENGIHTQAHPGRVVTKYK